MLKPREKQSELTQFAIKRIPLAVVWIGIIVLCLIYRDQITVDRIIYYTPDNLSLATAVMLLLFALKGVTVVIYGGILYAASGILFPLPHAIAVNIVGTVLMTTIPFLMGKKAGADVLLQLRQKNQKLELLQDLQSENAFFVAFFVRMIGMLPGDLVGMYLGASNMRYSRYISGTMLGLLPAVIAFSVMGMNIDDPGSPEFIISACGEAVLMLLSLALYILWHRKKKQKAVKNCGE